MPLPGRYRKKGEKVISSFDFIDIAKNRAVEVFYPIQYNDASTVKYGLTNSTSVPSTYTNIRKQTNGTSMARNLSITCETIIDAPFRIDGDVMISIPLRLDGDASTVGTAMVSGSLVVSGSNTVTTLGSAIGPDQTFTGGGEYVGYNTLKISVLKTKIKIGEYLKFNLECWSKGNDAGAVWTNVGLDPAGGGSYGGPSEHNFSGAVKSATKISIPIIIDL